MALLSNQTEETLACSLIDSVGLNEFLVISLEWSRSKSEVRPNSGMPKSLLNPSNPPSVGNMGKCWLIVVVIGIVLIVVDLKYKKNWLVK